MVARARLRVVAIGTAITVLAMPGVAVGDAAGHRDIHSVPAWLTATPDVFFVGGQAQTYQGNIGALGRRPIWLEAHMNRPGDRWTRLAGTETTTRRDGSFTIVRPAPSMFHISYRVKGKGGFKTPAQELTAASQELLAWAAESPAGWRRAIHPAVGQPYVVVVDTTPQQMHRSDLANLPVFPGRALTLQRRTGPTTWETVSTSTVGDDGLGVFTGLVESQPGTVVYRVRQERIYNGADQIGWQASFPLTLEIGESATPYAWWTKTTTDSVNVPQTRAGRTASDRYGWAEKLFDFDWDQGHDLDSLPTRGTKQEGSWLPSSDGSGRASAQNGQLVLFSSVSGRASTGDTGTTRASQVGNARRYGRWEVRMRWKVMESAAADFRIRLELVSPWTTGATCSPRSITLGTWTPHDRSFAFGMSKDGQHWSATKTFPDLTADAPVLAVEVAPDHTTWYVDSRPIGTVKGARHQLASRLVLRLSLEGDATEHNSTKVFSDWQRGFSLRSGRQVFSPVRLSRSGTGLCATGLDPRQLSTG